jgi:hypothetical protein
MAVLADKRWLLLLMGALALSVGATRGAASLSSTDVLLETARPAHGPAKQAQRVNPRLIRHYRTITWRWQTTMGMHRTHHALWPNTRPVLGFWGAAARKAYLAYLHPPHRRAWLCIHTYEGSWRDSGDPYWGGLQMDRGFMAGYAPNHLLHRGWADRWSPLEQMWVAERAYRSGRGFYAWPNTARMCGLI